MIMFNREKTKKNRNSRGFVFAGNKTEKLRFGAANKLKQVYITRSKFWLEKNVGDFHNNHYLSTGD